NEGSKKPVGTVYVGIASHTGWANAIRTQIGGTRAENKAGFVYFALLTAMQCWDDAMVRLSQEEKDAALAKLEAERLEQQREEERERRDQEAREHAPWQDEAWSEEQEGEEIGLEVEWSEDQEE
ncbi:MAG: CinA family protein, partial [Candidatus Thermoplasmatota archaeon]|nr:CinA family protein [Candidatus Thermoplasmatota archaeon]